MPRNKLTEEQKRIRREKCRQTCLERYGNPTYNNMEKNLKTKSERYGDPNYNNQEKYRKTCLERYGVEHHSQTEESRKHIREAKLTLETQQKYENTCLERYGCTNVNLSPEIMEKRRISLLERYGVESPLQCKEIKERQLDTLIKNNSYSKSKIEEEVYTYLVGVYGEENIIRQYKEERYPYNCDFYVKSEDLFIEVNNHSSHGGHPFDSNNSEDVCLLNQLIEKDDDWSKMIIDVWTVRDVNKFQVAKDNNLNYKVIYKSIDEIVNE